MSLRDLRRTAGQLLFAGFAGSSVPVELRSLAREFDLGGIVIFARNVEEPAQVAELALEARSLGRDRPAWVAVDQEGGRVARLKRPFTEWPPMMTLGRSGDPALAERFARAMAIELRTVGITLDFAPVLDVLTNPKNPVIGDRALAEDATAVASLGRVIIATLQREGIAACGKHFPGHGDTAQDSHHELAIVEQPPERLREVEWTPFRAAIEAGVAALMTAHVLVPALDETGPATLSRAIVDGVIRRELGFDGVVFTDDLEMKAVAARMPVPQAAAEAVAAGCDAVLVCGTDHDLQSASIENIIRAAEAQRIPWSRFDDAFRRHRRMQERFLAGVAYRPPPAAMLRALLGTTEHVRVADEMASFA